MPEALVGRQPIYNLELEVYGYELLFRSGGDMTADFLDGDMATSRVILNTFHEIGMSEVVGERRAFINLTRGFIVGEYALPVPREGVVLEVLENIPADPEVLRGLQELSEAGYCLALDDFILTEERKPMLEFANIVKFDLYNMNEEQVKEQIEVMRKQDLLLVAECIETVEEFESCVEMGFDLFQGYFLSRPKTIAGKRVPENRIGVLRVLAKLMDPNSDLDELERLISTDVTLSYKLLRHINSAAQGMPRKVDSVRETIVRLGRESIRKIVSLFLLSGMDDRPQDLIITAMLRGRMCELLGIASNIPQANSCFATGMFSTIDALMECPMADLLAAVPLCDSIQAALLERKGVLGEALECVLAYEKGDWENVSFQNLTGTEIKSAFLAAVNWTGQMEMELRGA